MCVGCNGNVLVAASNIAYFILAYWMWKHGLGLWWVLVIVGLVSTIFHLDPSSKRAYWTDIAIANIAIFSFFVYYRKSLHDRTTTMYATATFVMSLFFFFDSGSDRQAGRYVVMHSIWHLLTAISCYLYVKSTISKKRIEGGFMPLGTIFESMLAFGD